MTACVGLSVRQESLVDVSFHCILFCLVQRGDGCSSSPASSQRPLTRADFPSPGYGQRRENVRVPGKATQNGDVCSPLCLLYSGTHLRPEQTENAPCSFLQHCAWLFPCSNDFHWAIIGVFCFFRGKRKKHKTALMKYFIQFYLFHCHTFFSCFSVLYLKYHCKSNKN